MKVYRLLIYEGTPERIASDLNNPQTWVKGKQEVANLRITEKFCYPPGELVEQEVESFFKDLPPGVER